MAKAKKAAFGGYAVCFKDVTTTVEALFGAAPIPPSEMTKRLWALVKAKKLGSKG